MQPCEASHSDSNSTRFDHERSSERDSSNEGRVLSVRHRSCCGHRASE